MKPKLLFWLAILLFLTTVTFADSGRDQLFDANWKFLRADAPGAERPEFDDADWRVLDVPHDWSIEDLPAGGAALPAISVVPGQWRFHKGDDAAWKTPACNDSDWQEVTLPAYWEQHSQYTQENVYGWFRRRVELPANCQGKEVELLLGRIDDVDEAWLNGVRIGGTGSFPPNYRTAYDAERRYRVPAGVVHGDGSDVLAVRVFDGSGNGGIYAAGTVGQRVGPFDSSLSPGGASTGHVLGGIGWYRKYFTLHPADKGKRVAIRFDGVYMDADVWLNGQHLGNHPYGYTSFAYDLTPYLKPGGQPNVLAVRVRNEGKNSRWYSGSGIFRHVRLTVTDPVRVPTWGLYVTTPEVSRERAMVKVCTEIENGRDVATTVTVRTRLLDSWGNVVKTAVSSLPVASGSKGTAEQTLEVARPKLWSLTTPYLYRAETELIANGKTVDRAATPFGIRRIEVDAQNGFRINGEMVKLKGGCMHHDNGPLGSATIDRAEERRVELMKANGFNAIRTSHNPPSPAFLEACDRLGVVVIDEAFDQWEQSKNPQDYNRFFKDWAERDIASMVRRDRNHPSVVIWSIGNEIHERFERPDLAQRLREAVLAHDRTRPITAAICGLWDWPGKEWEKISDAAFQHLDIGGYNYLPEKYEPDHARHPERVMACTESYPKDLFDYWTMVEKHPYVIGDFVWTAMDYMGESGIGHAVPDNQKNDFLMPWPWFNAYCGDIDLCGFKKPQSYYRDVVWGRSQLEMAVHTPLPAGRQEKVSAWGWPDECQSWTWPGQEGKPMQVAIYSRCDTVRLELNSKVVGEKPVSAATKLTAQFELPYAPGELRALGLVKGKIVTTATLRTAGAPKKLRLVADRSKIRAERNDLSYVTVEVVDAAGQRVPNAKLPVRFSVRGDGELAALGCGSPDDATSFRTPQHTTFQGRCLAILRPKGDAGKITLRAESEGLEPATVTVQAHR